MPNIKVGYTDNKLFEDKDVLVQPMKDFAPEWYKNINTNQYDDTFIFKKRSKVKTVKSCPSFVEIFTEGVVILAHQDFLFKYEKESGHWEWETPLQVDNEFAFMQVEDHGDIQMVDWLPPAANVQHILKFNMPFQIFTDKGYSSRQLPMPYYFNPDWHVSYGTIQTDNIHEVNLQINITTADKEIFIKKGEPLCVYVPFKREKTVLENFDIYDNKYSKFLKAARRSRYINKSKFRFAYKDIYE